MTTTNKSSTDNRFYREPGAQPADGGPAFPVNTQRFEDGSINVYPESGMTLRAYAAIKLRVPDSGIDWLDAMIRAALHDELAAKALQGKLADNLYSGDPFETALLAYEYADTMLKARG